MKTVNSSRGLGLAEFALKKNYTSTSPSASIGFKIPLNVTTENSFIVLLEPSSVDRMNSSILEEMPTDLYYFFREEDPNLMLVGEDDSDYFEGIMWPFSNPGMGIWSICIFDGPIPGKTLLFCDDYFNFSNLGCANITINEARY